MSSQFILTTVISIMNSNGTLTKFKYWLHNKQSEFRYKMHWCSLKKVFTTKWLIGPLSRTLLYYTPSGLLRIKRLIVYGYPYAHCKKKKNKSKFGYYFEQNQQLEIIFEIEYKRILSMLSVLQIYVVLPFLFFIFCILVIRQYKSWISLLQRNEFKKPRRCVPFTITSISFFLCSSSSSLVFLLFYQNFVNTNNTYKQMKNWTFFNLVSYCFCEIFKRIERQLYILIR